MDPSISISTDVAADPDLVWSIVTDLPRMGEFSPENVGGYWTKGFTGARLGAKLRGTNRNGKLKWSTFVTVVEYEPGRLMTFDVRSQIGLRVARWQYRVEPIDGGCRLTENWFRVGNKFVQRYLGPKVTGQKDRPGFNVHSIEHTLERVKAVAESASARR